MCREGIMTLDQPSRLSQEMRRVVLVFQRARFLGGGFFGAFTLFVRIAVMTRRWARLTWPALAVRKCQWRTAAAWLAAREAEVLRVPYFHFVFALPAVIGAIAYQNKAKVSFGMQFWL
jgi:hypothetical protein